MPCGIPFTNHYQQSIIAQLLTLSYKMTQWLFEELFVSLKFVVSAIFLFVCLQKFMMRPLQLLFRVYKVSKWLLCFILVTPLDVVKTRLQAQSNPFPKGKLKCAVIEDTLQSLLLHLPDNYKNAEQQNGFICFQQLHLFLQSQWRKKKTTKIVKENMCH